MYRKLNCLFFWLFTFLLITSLFGANFTSRWGHAATIVKGNRLYIFGGRNSTDYINELLILDMNQSFSTSSLPWVLGPSGFACSNHSVNTGGSQLDMLVIYGGEPSEYLLSYFNTATNEWNNNVTSSSSSSTPSTRTDHSGVIRLSDSTLYVFGGMSSQGITNEFFSLDTRTNTWNVITNDNSPTGGRYQHSATMLNNGKMYVIGGYATDDGMVNMSRISVYDSLNEMWSTQTAIGNVPQPRRIHRAVGTDDGKIIIFGGTDANFTQYYNDVLILDTTTNPPNWTNQLTQGLVPAGRYGHTMTLAGTNVIIAFGYLPTWDSDTNFYVLDINTWTWKTQYQPNFLTSTSGASTTSSATSSIVSPTASSTPSKSNEPLIIGLTTAGSLVVVVAIVSAILYFRSKYTGTPLPNTHPNNNPSSGNLTSTTPNHVHRNVVEQEESGHREAGSEVGRASNEESGHREAGSEVGSSGNSGHNIALQ